MFRNLVKTYLDARFGRDCDEYDVVTCRTCGTEAAFAVSDPGCSDAMWDYLMEQHDPKTHDSDWATFTITRR